MSGNSSHHYVLIFAGGAGTRLWPLSRRALPKQFQVFAGNETLLQHMVRLCTQVVPIEQVLVVAVDDFREIVHRQVPQLPKDNFLAEPSRRDNGPAITLAMLELQRRDPEAVSAIFWSDHLIQDADEFATTLRAAFAAAHTHQDALVTVGVKPRKADTGLGYIRIGDEIEHGELPVYEVRQFIEKPDLATATKFAASWNHFVNTGYKIWTTQFFRSELERIHPELTPYLDQVAEHYEQLPKISIEYLLTQHLERILMIPADMGWSDVGNWDEYHEVRKTQSGNDLVTEGTVYSVNSRNSLVSAKGKPIALVGVENLIVVESDDAILIMDKGAGQDIKQLTEILETSNPDLL